MAIRLRPEHRIFVLHRLCGAWAIVLLLSACSTQPYRPGEWSPADFATDQHTQTREGITVSTTIIDDEEAMHIYGVDLSMVGLQAIWLRIENRSDHAHWLLVSALDPEYFAPDEAAALLSHTVSSDEKRHVMQRFRELAIPLKIPAGESSEGFVLAPLHEGGRYVEVQLAGNRHVVPFGFAVTLASGEFDFEGLDPEQIAKLQARPDLSLPELRQRLRDFPCCVTNASGDGAGDPINLALVGSVDDLLASLSRGGWSFTQRIGPGSIKRMISASLSGSSYEVAPVSSLYLFGRKQDIALQRARNTIVQRNHLRLWVAPYTYGGRTVWVGQVSRDIDVKLTTHSPSLTTHVIDPNVDEAREHLLQSLMVTGAVSRFGFVRAMSPVSEEQPRTNLTEDPYFTDGLRLFAELSGSNTVPAEDLEFIEWQNSEDPNDPDRYQPEPD